MINSINSNMSMTPLPRTERNLTENQQLLISDTLSQFDAENLSKSDAQTIVEIFSAARIQPGAALEKAMSDFGFDAKSVGDLANVSNKRDMPPPPPPPKQDTDEISSMVDYLKELLDEKLSANGDSALSDEDKQSILTQILEKFGNKGGQSIINTSA